MKKKREDIYLRELHIILKFSALINSSLRIETVINDAMKWTEEFINAEASSIFELDEEKDELFIRHARGEKKEIVESIRLKKGEGIAGRVVQTGRPMVVQDVRKEKRFSGKFDRVTGFNTRSMICVPLVLRGKTIGAIQVLNKKSQEPFSDADLEILTNMSQHIAIAMDNARLYHRLEEKFELTTRELKTTQEKLIRSERLAAMGHLVNGVAHEIRNPITVIGGFTQRIKEASNGNAELQKYADIILDETARLERLVKKVHDLIDTQSASLHPGNIEQVIDEALKTFIPLADQQGVKITSRINQGIPMIKMDRYQLITALSNLLENALESIQGSGRIDIHVDRDDSNQVLIIKVKDTGSGIAPDGLDSIYDPFVTSKTRGVGLGLTMVHQIVENHKGEISISSQEAEGTTVTIRLPLSNDLMRKESE